MGKEISVIVTTPPENALKVLASPVVMGLRDGWNCLTAPARSLGRASKNYILNRPQSYGDTEGFIEGALLGGIVGFVGGILTSAATGVGLLTGLGYVAAGIAAGPVAVFAAVSAGYGAFGAVKGVCNGATKCLRRFVAPVLLKMEEREAMKKQQAALPAPKVETVDLLVRMQVSEQKELSREFGQMQQSLPVPQISSAVARYIKH